MEMKFTENLKKIEALETEMWSSDSITSQRVNEIKAEIAAIKLENTTAAKVMRPSDPTNHEQVEEYYQWLWYSIYGIQNTLPSNWWDTTIGYLWNQCQVMEDHLESMQNRAEPKLHKVTSLKTVRALLRDAEKKLNEAKKVSRVYEITFKHSTIESGRNMTVFVKWSILTEKPFYQYAKDTFTDQGDVVTLSSRKELLAILSDYMLI